MPIAEGQFDFAARSDPGRVRENNEDSFRDAPELSLFVLSDGMGGYASGETASRIATDTVVDYCRAAERDASVLSPADRLPGFSEVSSGLAAAIRRANSAVREAARKDPRCRGMGATLVAARFHDDRVTLAHVGDSRAYRLRGAQLEQLTQDHSFVAEQVRRGAMTREEAERSQLQNVLLRALGPEEEVEIEVDEQLVLEGDTILLCSDGLTREVSEAQIAAILEDAEATQTAADQLVEAANRAGGADNITVIVLRPVPKRAALARIGRWLVGAKESG